MFPRNFRFTLLTLAVAVATIGMCCSVLHYQIRSVHSDAALERVAIRRLRALEAGYFCTQKDFGALVNCLVSDADRKRIVIVSASGTSATPDAYERELMAVLSKLEHLQFVSLAIPNIKADPAHYLDVQSIDRRLVGVTVAVD